MNLRHQLLSAIADRIVTLPAPEVLRVAIDGVDGAGKTCFADELAEHLASAARPIIRSSVDFFHNPRSIRMRQGKTSPRGFYEDSFNYHQLITSLLDPLDPGGSRRFRRACFDHRLDAPVAAPEEFAVAGSILLLDGIFLHRPELRPYWDFSIFLQVAFAVSIPRVAARDKSIPDPAAPENARYVEGQKIYLAECDPQSRASLVIDNGDLSAPFIINLL